MVTAHHNTPSSPGHPQSLPRMVLLPDYGSVYIGPKEMKQMGLVQGSAQLSMLLSMATCVGSPLPRGCIERLMGTAAQECIWRSPSERHRPIWMWARRREGSRLLPFEISEGCLCGTPLLPSLPHTPPQPEAVLPQCRNEDEGNREKWNSRTPSGT